ncbi:Protein kinase superfamily protein [Zostera marina]|uniref:non-specific serine/threonine protein kinase n=1 Tax=Zostera marina TaxID=29655 RepID=A0A0K9NHY9_ZOSMR|nr:Protein kinase superfamily protein [Zostera marina]
MFTKRKRRRDQSPPNYPSSSTSASPPTYANPISPIFKDRAGSRRISPSPNQSVVPLPIYYQKDQPPETSIIHFNYNDLSDITNGFARDYVIGEGGFGCVYKAMLPNGHEVAVKQLKLNSGQGEREFRTEVETISRVHHRRLVSLVGYCIEGNERLLVYDFVPNGTLEFHLHRPSSDQVFDWNTRLKVAIGAAHGIAYLHEDCIPSIIHRDIKSANILLDNNFEAQVADFGLAKFSMDAQTHVSTGVKGTFGYLAPEYASTGNLTVRSDVFSFGVVLLELITGRKPITGLVSLVEWAQPLLSIALETGNMEEMIDPKLGENYDKNTMQIMMVVASACVRHTASMRPRMRTVVSVLENHGIKIDIQNGVIPGQGIFSNVSGYSQQIEMFNRMVRGEDFEDSVNTSITTTSELTDTSLSSKRPLI